MTKPQSITVCAFLYNSQGKMFTAKRADDKAFMPSTFELPGGHVDYGESLEVALQREFMEEFEAEIVVEKPFHAFCYFDQNQVHAVEIVYYCQLKPNSKIKLKPKEHSQMAWIGKDEVDKYFSYGDEERDSIMAGFDNLENNKNS
jgi:8-oxo-dGTP diphosphatase